MSDRIGTCTSCGAQYGNIPDTVTATKVRCRKCGGVVVIPPLASPEPESGLQATPLGKSKENAERPKKAAPVDRSRLTQPAPPRKPAPPRPAKPVAPPRKPAPPRPQAPAAADPPRRSSPKPTAPLPEAETPKKKDKGAELIARLKAKKEAQRRAQQAASSPAAPQAAPPSPKRPRPAGRPAPKRPSRGQRSPRTGSSKSREASPTHEHPHTKKGPSPVMVLVSVVALALIGGGIWYLTQAQAKKNAELQAAAEEAAQKRAAAQAAAEEAAAKQAEEAAARAAAKKAAKEAAKKKAATIAKVASASAAPSQPSPADSAPFVLPEPGQRIDLRGVTDPALVHLDRVTPAQKWSGTDDAEWKDVNDDLELFLEDAGAQSNRAGRRLVAAGRSAFPAIVNGMLRTDWSDPDGIRLASSLNNLIVEIGHGTNLGWKSIDRLQPGSDEWAAAVVFDQRVAANWYNFWLTKFSVDDKQWEGFAKKLDAKAAKKKAAPTTVSPGVDEFDE